MKIDIAVSIKRHNGGEWKNSFLQCEREEVNNFHQQLCEEHPYSFINFRWDKGESFIYGAPHQMLVDQNTLTLEEYMAKWYGI